MVPLKGKKVSDVREAFTYHFWDVPKKLKMTLTYDRGKEMIQHKQFSQDTGIDVYFADPHSPWQRGSCENTNELIRDFFPKGIDFSKIIYEEIKHCPCHIPKESQVKHGYSLHHSKILNLY